MKATGPKEKFHTEAWLLLFKMLCNTLNFSAIILQTHIFALYLHIENNEGEPLKFILS